MSRTLATIFKGTALLAVLFCGLLLTPAHADGISEIVIVNNAALKTAQSLTIQVYRMNGKSQTLVKNKIVTASDDCTNGCDEPSMAIDSTPGDYKIQVGGDVVLDTSAVTFPVHTGDEFVWMISNRQNAPHIHAHAPGVVMGEDKSPFRIDLVTYTKGSGIDPVIREHHTSHHTFWPFKPNTSTDSYIKN